MGEQAATRLLPAFGRFASTAAVDWLSLAVARLQLIPVWNDFQTRARPLAGEAGCCKSQQRGEDPDHSGVKKHQCTRSHCPVVSPELLLRETLRPSGCETLSCVSF